MTIAVGFYRGDGIVLAADTQETVLGFKKHQPKIEIRPHVVYPGKQFAVFAGAGDGPLIDSLIEKLWNAMRGKPDIDQMVEAAEDELIKTFQRLVPSYHAEYMPEVQMLVGLWSPPGDLELIAIDGPILTRHIISKSIGCGKVLSTYIENRLLPNKSGLDFAIPIAVYIVDQAKAHVDGVGGETHVVTMMHDGKLKTIPQFEVQPKTKQIEEIDNLARYIAAIAMNEELSTEVVRAEISECVNGIIETREKKGPKA